MINYTLIWKHFTDWMETHGLMLLLIVVAAIILQRISNHIIEKTVRKLVLRGNRSEKDEVQREDTLIQVVESTVTILIWVTTALMLLSESGVAIGPLLAAAGIAGVAVGFGGQYLIRDIISGFFILIENQYRTDDVVCFDGTCGLVENMSLRMTTLRDLDGTVHHVPHGEIKKVSNLSKHFARVNMDIGVSYSSNLEHVIAVVNRVGQELADDPAWKDQIIKAPQFLRVDDFADSAVVIKILGDTLPLKQWDVSGELRLRLKIAFDKEKIEIPFPQRVIHSAK